MLVILGVRTAISVWDVVWSAIKIQIGWLIINIVFGVVGFIFIAWCLAKIGEVQGYRRVLGVRAVSLSSPTFHSITMTLFLTLWKPNRLGTYSSAW